MNWLPRRFSLRLLMVILTLSAISVGYCSNSARVFRAEQLALRELMKTEKFDIDYQFGPPLPGMVRNPIG